MGFGSVVASGVGDTHGPWEEAVGVSLGDSWGLQRPEFQKK